MKRLLNAVAIAAAVLATPAMAKKTEDADNNGTPDGPAREGVRRALPAHADGTSIGFTPVTLEVRPKALRIFR